jgi:hypothetical protein
MRIPNLLLAFGLALSALAVAALPVSAKSLNATSHVSASLETDDETGVTSLVISGDAKANSIVVTEINGTIYVLGQAKTRINRKLFATFDASEVTEISVSMAGGNDTVVVALDLAADTTLDADGGAGDDSLTVSGEIDAAATISVDAFETLDPPDLDL